MEERAIKISLETAKEWYKGDNEALKNLALQAFNEKELQDVTCVKSWAEFCKNYYANEGEYSIDSFSNINIHQGSPRHVNANRNLLATKKDAESFLALIQLKRLRDQWWEALDWKPDYINGSVSKYTIRVIKNEINIDILYTMNRFLAFPTREIAEEFLNCFKNLINKAKELI